MKHFSTEKDFKNSEEGHLLYTKAVWYMKKVEKWCLTIFYQSLEPFLSSKFKTMSCKGNRIANQKVYSASIFHKKKFDMPFNLLYNSSIN